MEAVWANGAAYRRNKRNAAGTWLMVGRDDSGATWTVSIKWADEEEGVLRAVTGWLQVRWRGEEHDHDKA